MVTSSIHTVFKAVVVTKLIYAATSWCGFATADDRQRLEVVIRRGIRSGLFDREHPTLEQLVEDVDDKLFTYVLHNQQHVLHTLVPGTAEIPYLLRPRCYNLVLSTKNFSIVGRDFITCMLYKDAY